jgi:hypothetical protein
LTEGIRVSLSKGLLVSVIAAGALSLPAAAQAAPLPPVLSSVGHSGRYLTASWTLAAGTEADFIEAATSPETYPEGNFLAENTPLVDFLDPGQAQYKAPVTLDPGVYYVHVAAFDPLCQVSPCLDSFSDTARLTVEGDPPPAQSGLPFSSPPPDKATAFAKLAVASSQRAGNLMVEVAMPEAGTITVGGTVSVSNASRVFKIKPVSASAVAGKAVKIRVKLSRQALTAARRALKRRRKVRANLTITVRDKAGNSKTGKRAVRLKR